MKHQTECSINGTFCLINAIQKNKQNVPLFKILKTLFNATKLFKIIKTLFNATKLFKIVKTMFNATKLFKIVKQSLMQLNF